MKHTPLTKAAMPTTITHALGAFSHQSQHAAASTIAKKTINPKTCA